MRHALLACLVLCALSAGRVAAGEEGDEGEEEEPRPQETCKEILERVKRSDCVKPVARFLDGASVFFGIGLNSMDLDITSGDTALASLIGILNPTPTFGLSLPNRYFGRSRWGYGFTFTYTNSIAYYQDLGEEKEPDQVKDLGSHAVTTFLSLSPSLFVSIGARDEDPDTYWRYGVGIGGGWASVRGAAYHNQSGGPARQACVDAADSLLAGDITKAGFRAACPLSPFSESGLGFGTAVFTDFRWAFVYGRVSASTLFISSQPVQYKPTDISLKLAYIHDL
jgi:hypothetical protein